MKRSHLILVVLTLAFLSSGVAAEEMSATETAMQRALEAALMNTAAKATAKRSTTNAPTPSVATENSEKEKTPPSVPSASSGLSARISQNLPEGTSLFFSPEEEARGLALLGQGGLALQETSGLRIRPLDSLHLSALAYYGPSRWVVWLDELALTPQQPSDLVLGVRVLAVTPHAVTLAIDGRPVTLKPNQRFERDSARILEGR